MPQVCVSSGGTRNSKSSELVVGSEGIDSETEFLILASTGVWEVTSLIKCWKCGISLNFTL